LLGRVRIADPFPGVPARAEPTSNEVSTIMANGSGAAVFYQEVVDAIAKNPPDVAHLVVLRDLCSAVDAGNRLAASRLAKDLSNLSGIEGPLFAISSELFYTLMARILLQGWFEELDVLLDWNQSRFGSREADVATKWQGILMIVKEEPQSIGLSSLFVPHLLLVLHREEEWKRALNGLKGALRHLAKVERPKMKVGDPPSPPTHHEVDIPFHLDKAVEQFFRLLQMLIQQMLELALMRLERDSDDVHVLRKLQGMQAELLAVLEEEKQRPKEKKERTLFRTIRVAEFRYGRAGTNLHRFLDAFPRHQSRSVVFHSLDREDKNEPAVRGEKIWNMHRSRTRQIEFCLMAYGHPRRPGDAPSEWDRSRRALIKSKHGGRLKLTGNDDIVAFLGTVFEEKFAELTGPGRDSSLKDEASVIAWRTTVDVYNRYFGQLTSHSRLNLTEGPPNYLTHAFPRNIGGRLFHDCGVYAVRSVYTLLSVLEWINRVHPNLTGDVTARWVRLPLHVGVLITIRKFGLLLQHNDHLVAIDNDNVLEVRRQWLANRPDYDSDPFGPYEETLKFHEDLSASAFSSDLDMPVVSTPVLGAGEPVTIQTIWNSYQRKVVPPQLFSGLVGAPNAPQYQFDNRYLKLSEAERVWFNENVVVFWNEVCNAIWTRWGGALTDARVNNNSVALAEKKQGYTEELMKGLGLVIQSYKKILSEKQQLSLDVRADTKLLLPGIRIVASVRIGTVLPAARNIMDHINDVSKPEFRFPPGFVPPFANPDKELMEVP
jgi:hypothetical protein